MFNKVFIDLDNTQRYIHPLAQLWKLVAPLTFHVFFLKFKYFFVGIFFNVKQFGIFLKKSMFHL